MVSRWLRRVVLGVCILHVPAFAHAQPAERIDAQNLIPPKLKADSPATYPEEALRDHVHDTVVVDLVLEVGTAGDVRSAVVDRPAGHGFDEAAIAAAKKLVFEPASRGGNPVAAKIRFSYTFAPPPARLLGRIARQVSDAPIPNARVVVRDARGAMHETTTAADGSFRIDGLPFGQAHVEVEPPPSTDGTPSRFKGTSSDETLEPGEETALTLRLASVAIEPAAPADKGAGTTPDEAPLEVRVRGERPPREVTKHSMSRQEMFQSPGTNGDALRSLQNLPGIARPPPFSGQLVVRGSAPNDTQFFVDGTNVPIVYHFGGLSSVVPTEALDKIDFYPGNFGTQFGRGMGGIIDIGLRNPNADGKWHAMFQLDSIDVRTLVERSLGGGWSFFAGGRRSYFDAWIKLLAPSGITTAPKYYDYQVMVRKEFSPDHDLRFVFFGSDDSFALFGSGNGGGNFALGGNLSAAISFWRAQARYQNKLTSSTRLSAVVATGQDRVQFGFGEDYADIKTMPVSGRLEIAQRIARFLTANAGMDILTTPYEVTVRFPRPEKPGVPGGGVGSPPLIAKNDDNLYTPGAYLELEVVPKAGTRLVPGIRADYTNQTGDWTYSPRIAARQDLNRESGRRTTAKGGIGYFYQPPSPFELDPIFGQGRTLISNRSAHISAGIEQELGAHAELSVETFYKKLDHLVAQDNGNRGDGRIVGTETLLRWKNDPKLFGWFAYTISRSERRDDPTETLRLSQYDQTHILTVLASKGWDPGLRFGARFRFVSGGLYTPNSYGGGVLDTDRGAYQPVTTLPPFNTRLPPFHQLDLRFEKSSYVNHLGKVTAYVDVQNVYYYSPVQGVVYNYNYTTSRPVRGLPTLSIIGARVDF